ncbi:MAG: hypothetical protein SGI90_01820 [Candidatus Eisenbacteria bacterium]|nr:hypothetical protein [Candidatus Eisenbacteria bacterium]
MGDGDGAVPGKEPGDKAQPPAPPADGGAFFVSPGHWFKRHKDLSEAFKLSSYKRTLGVTARFVGSLTTSITRGHSHNTTFGYARSVVFLFENKFNLGVVFAFIRKGRHEETTRNRSEYVIGAKYERYDADRALHEAGKATKDDDVRHERKMKIFEQHVQAIERELSTKLDQDIKNFFAEHDKVEALLKTRETEVNNANMEVEKWIEKTTKFQGKIKDLKEECKTTEAKYSGTFKSIAATAHEITSSAKVEKNLKSEVRFMAGSMVKLAATITKAT